MTSIARPKPDIPLTTNAKLQWADFCERLCDVAGLLEEAAKSDNFDKKWVPRKRGDKTKGPGAQLLEENAVALFKQCKRLLKQQGMNATEAQDSHVRLGYFR